MKTNDEQIFVPTRAHDFQISKAVAASSSVPSSTLSSFSSFCASRPLLSEILNILAPGVLSLPLSNHHRWAVSARVVSGPKTSSSTLLWIAGNACMPPTLPPSSLAPTPRARQSTARSSIALGDQLAMWTQLSQLPTPCLPACSRYIPAARIIGAPPSSMGSGKGAK